VYLADDLSLGGVHRIKVVVVRVVVVRGVQVVEVHVAAP
jgi:hypothetical protein